MARRGISVASFAFHGMLYENTMDVFGYLESCRYRYGLEYADIWNGFIKSYELDDLKKVKKAMDDRGMRLANLCCDCAHPWHDDPDELQRNLDMAQKCLLAAEVLEAQTVRFDLGVWTNHISEEQIDFIAGKFRAYAEVGKRAGFLVGPENHWGASTRIDVQRRMFREVNHPNYGMLLHLGNWNAVENDAQKDQALGEAASRAESGRADLVIPQLVEQGVSMPRPLGEDEKMENNLAMAPYAMHMHICARHSERAEEIVPKLLDAGYRGVLGVEHHSGKHEYENVEWQIANVRRALALMEDGEGL